MTLLGKLDWSAVPFDQPIIMGTVGVMVVAIVSVLSWVTLKGYVPYLWREWITSVDHKRIGVMYIVLALVMLLRGFADGIMMRTQHDQRQHDIHDADAFVVDGGDPLSPEIGHVTLERDPGKNGDDGYGDAAHRAHDDRLIEGNSTPVQFTK